MGQAVRSGCLQPAAADNCMCQSSCCKFEVHTRYSADWRNGYKDGDVDNSNKATQTTLYITYF